MKTFISFLILLNISFSSTAQSNDSIRIEIGILEVADDVYDDKIGLKIADELRSHLNKDFLMLTTKDVKRMKMRSWITKNEEEVEKKDIKIEKLRVPNYSIEGTIYSDRITISLFNAPADNKELYTTTKKWKLTKNGRFPRKKIEQITEDLRRFLNTDVGNLEPRAKLELKSEDPKIAVYLNKDELGTLPTTRMIPINGARYVRIIAKNENELVKLEDRFINRIKIKKNSGNYKIKRSVLSAQFSTGINNFEDNISTSADFAIKLLLFKGLHIGVQTQYHYLNYQYDYPTLEELNSNISENSHLMNFALLANYERYISSMNLIWHTDAYFIALPIVGGGIRTGFSYEKRPELQLKFGYQWFQADVDQAVFNTFGNAKMTSVRRNFEGLYLGLSWQQYLY